MAKIKCFEGEGYKPVWDYNQWRVAVLLPDVSNDFMTFKSFGKHNTTEELFVLLEGEAYMVLGGKEEQATNLEILPLKKNRIVVVEEKEWHLVLLKENAKVLIVENVDTSNSNSMEIQTEIRNKIKDRLADLQRK